MYNFLKTCNSDTLLHNLCCSSDSKLQKTIVEDFCSASVISIKFSRFKISLNSLNLMNLSGTCVE